MVVANETLSVTISKTAAGGSLAGDLNYSFPIYICAQTLDARTIYAEEAEANWLLNGTGTISNVNSPKQTFTWTGAAGSGVIPPTSWSDENAGSQAVTNGFSFNSLLAGEAFVASPATPIIVKYYEILASSIAANQIGYQSPTSTVLPNGTAYLPLFSMKSTHGSLTSVDIGIHNYILWKMNNLHDSSPGTSSSHQQFIMTQQDIQLFLPLLIHLT